MPLYLKMSENINETMRHLKFRYISILANLLRCIYGICGIQKSKRHFLKRFDVCLHQSLFWL